ncbi:MAG: methyltransferase domain-containing protein [Rhodobacter sp.]|nr:methyltransferase domain-containing protein [Rhodobacter sp.]
MSPKATLFPESYAGGFSRVDGTVQFYMRVRALLRPDDTVLDLGAGRGVGLVDDPVTYRRDLRTLRGHCQEVIGCDVGEAVLTNPGLDRAFLIPESGKLDLEDASIDLILSDHVIEHIVDPASFSAEVARVLKPGGWFCARTPNRWGYIAIASRLVPNHLHARVLAKVQDGRKEEDVFPTVYQMNTGVALRRWFPAQAWRHCSYAWESEPGYFGRSAMAWRAVMVATKFLPRSMASTLLVFIQKREAV